MKQKKLLSLLLVLVMALALFPAAALAAAEVPDSLKFDTEAEGVYQGEFTADGVTFKTYQVTYVARPITGFTWAGNPSENYFKMNIKVPVSYNGAAFSQADIQRAPILFYNPWGGDAGSAVGSARLPVDRNNTALVKLALQEGWVVAEPGMRGTNCAVDGINYGKLPYPIVDLKAAIRYLRANDSLIPGDTNKIIAAGSSSGGSATVMLGTSGNHPDFLPYLYEMGAIGVTYTGTGDPVGDMDPAHYSDGGDDSIFAAAPSCPVMIRDKADQAIAWERWGDFSGYARPTEAGAAQTTYDINKAMADEFASYLNGLGLKATSTAGGVSAGAALTAANYANYLYTKYVIPSAEKHLASQADVDDYLAGEKPADAMYGSSTSGRAWMTELEAADGWKAYNAYVFGTNATAETNLMDPANTYTLSQLQYDRAMLAPASEYEANGLLKSTGASRGPYGNASTASFGSSADAGAVFSSFGRAFIAAGRTLIGTVVDGGSYPTTWETVTAADHKITVEPAADALITKQVNFVDPMYYAAQSESVLAETWFMRTGARDIVTPLPLFFALATKLENLGKDVDAIQTWDQGHGLTNDLGGLLDWAKTAVVGEDTGNPFTDVKSVDWFYPGVMYAYENGLMNGVSATVFDPDGIMNRAMIVTVLYRLAGSPAVSGASNFTDLSQDWYKDAVQWAVAAGITTGTSATAFDPAASLTREQLAVFLYRYAEYMDYDISGAADLGGYTDAGGISPYALAALSWVNANGIITGTTETTLEPQGASSRAVIATVLMRFCEAFVK